MRCGLRSVHGLAAARSMRAAVGHRGPALLAAVRPSARALRPALLAVSSSPSARSADLRSSPLEGPQRVPFDALDQRFLPLEGIQIEPIDVLDLRISSAPLLFFYLPGSDVERKAI